MATRVRRNSAPAFDPNVGLGLHRVSSGIPFDTYFTNCYVLHGSEFRSPVTFPFTIHAENSVL